MVKLLRSIAFPLLLTTILLSSCSKQNKDASNYLETAKKAYKTGNYDQAKQKIDSIKILFPKALDVISNALVLLQDVRYSENIQNIQFCDSALQVDEHKLNKLKLQFTYVKDQYMEYGIYVPKIFPLEKAFEKNSLRSAVSEKGNFFIESVLSNSSINHNQIRLTRNDTSYVESQKVTSDGLNYQVENYEIVRFTSKDANVIGQFVYAFQKEPLTLSFIGNKIIKTTLSDANKKGIGLSFELASLMKQMNDLTIEKQKSMALIEYLEFKNDSIDQKIK